MIYNQFKKQAKHQQNKPALIYENKTYTWLELLQLIDQLAAAFVHSGLKPQDRVAFYLTNCPEQIISYYACFKIGLTIVPINVRLKAKEVLTILHDCCPKMLISESKLFVPLENKLKTADYLTHCFLTDAIPPYSTAQSLHTLFQLTPPVFPMPQVLPEQPAIILYTSGTTGKAKGVVHEYLHLQHNNDNQHALIKHSPHDKTLLMLSLCYTFGVLRQLLPAYAAGVTIVLLKNFNASEALSLIQQHEITLLYAVPVMYWQLVHEVKKIPDFSHKLRCCIASGDAVPLALHQEFKSSFAISLCETMAQTETMMYAANPVTGTQKPGSIGLPLKNMRYTILDEQGHPVPSNQIGEIAVQGNTLMKEYLNNPELTTASYKNGWFCTGDLGMMDKDGWLWFRGRKKQLIIRNGLNISPQEVEAALYQHPQVLECAVIGLPHPLHGEIVAACLVMKDPTFTDGQALLDFVQKDLAYYKIPEQLIFVTALPKGTTGKIAREQLTKLFNKKHSP